MCGSGPLTAAGNLGSFGGYTSVTPVAINTAATLAGTAQVDGGIPGTGPLPQHVFVYGTVFRDLGILPGANSNCATGIDGSRAIIGVSSEANGAHSFRHSGTGPTTNTFGSFDITTTDGVTDALIGAHYDTPNPDPPTSLWVHGFDVSPVICTTGNVSGGSIGSLETYAPGMIDLFGIGLTEAFAGGPSGNYAQSSSSSLYYQVTGTLLDGTRIDATFIDDCGNLLFNGVPAVPINPVPETSSVVSFGLLLMLGAGGVAIRNRKKKDVAAA